jgi:hypothetical protein
MCGGLRYGGLILPVKQGIDVPRILTIRKNSEPLGFDVPLS